MIINPIAVSAFSLKPMTLDPSYPMDASIDVDSTSFVTFSVQIATEGAPPNILINGI